MNRSARVAHLAASSTLALALVAMPAREAAAAPARAVFALVVTNNRSAELGRPELRYADDDGAKYYEAFRMLAPEDNVHLLTELDTDSTRLFPVVQKKASPPTKAGVKAAAAQIARAAGEATRDGAEVDFYFIFAGHGDVDQGKGFLELRDGRFTSDEVEAMLKSIPSTRSHVILDSCNSFFVLNARKPGGQRLAVTAKAARSLSDRLPNVGVFLSTSAEAEVFEWSELQSGIFSHAVRSGMLGGADANGDGEVTYHELRAFVEVASEKVKNPLYRPHVFAQGPRGDGRTPLFPVQRASGARLELDAESPVRLTVRDENALPWIDVHKERGAAATLRIPASWVARATVEEREVSESGGRPLHRYTLDGAKVAEPIRLAALTPTEPPVEPRGPNEVLRMLFAAPFGPRALAAHARADSTESAEIYGVSRQDALRMDHILFETADFSRTYRQLTSGAMLTIGGFGVATTIGLLTTDLRNDPSGRVTIGASALSGALLLGGGIYGLLTLSEEEKLYRDFATSLRATSAAGLPSLIDRTEERLFKLAARARTGRLITGSAFTGVSLLCLGMFAKTQLEEPGNYTLSMEYGGLATISAAASAAFFLFPTPVERFASAWAADSGRLMLPPPTFSLTPVQSGKTITGAMLSVSGAF
ncbi:hypothetical protein [Polyangium sorediatum]|uniref:EF-hand domain-containing protein n=1 Tax=Polyangium sorediatum TaxID=889274 RepID=A0ABT6NNT3_9BACT|nr:hypothetical protein [Polyangium sorediatum]MDI1429845.1 hypothetical protein [Polyangium sorediatum]